MPLSDFFGWRGDGRAEPVSPPPIEPMDSPPGSPGRKRLAAIIGTGAVAGLIAVAAQWEGKSNDPYRDLVGVWTVCYGETRVAMRHYTNAECDDMLANGLADFAGPVLARNPELRGHDPQLIAAVSFSYNIGTGAYRTSGTARRFSEGDWKGACNSMLSYNKGTFARPQRGAACVRKANGKYLCTIKGLTRRREAERRICLRGL